MLLASLLFGLQEGFDSNLGGKLFGYLHFTMFCAIWILVPLLAADSISRERREGTLGLLFLTGLCGPNIALAKSLAHGLRALSLWVATAPVLTLSFLLGGVTWQEAMLSVVINFSAMCWALAAGVLGSAWSKTWGRAVLRAVLFAMFFLLVVSMLAGWCLASILRSGSASFWGSPVSAFFQLDPSKWDYLFVTGIGFISNLSAGFAGFVFRTVTNGQLIWLAILVMTTSLLGSILAVRLAGTKTGRIWRETPLSPRQVWLEKTFCTPVIWISFFHRWMKRKLEKNPVGWLEQRTWSGRLVTWGWLAVIISIYSLMLTNPNLIGQTSQPQYLMGWLLVLSMAITAAGSFRRERESGVLELLLVSPLSERTILSGRLRGLWGQFLPAFAALLLAWLYLISIRYTTAMGDDNDTGSILFYASTFFTAPVIGLYFSLRCRKFMTALLAAMAVSVVVPIITGTILAIWWFTFVQSGAYFSFSEMARLPLHVSLVQILIAVSCWRSLRYRLKTRSFPLDRASA